MAARLHNLTDIEVKRSDPVYMAHAYLTKVPVPAIVPFIEAFTQPGDVVLDPFAGSGMTGVAAMALGRRARLFDIAVLGRHVGRNYANLVRPEVARKHAAEVVRAADARVGPAYATACGRCEQSARLVKTVWTVLVECPGCGSPVAFYRALESAGWRKECMRCPTCEAAVTGRARRVGEEAVVDYLACACSPTQVEQDHRPATADVDTTGLWWPDEPIGEDRQMFLASALGRHGLTTTASFYSRRNLAALAALWAEIALVDEPEVREKLRFAFTAILTRASKRYQWSRQRPLNAANANYYVGPVFYEWNVFDLFERKVEAALKSDHWLRQLRRVRGLPADPAPGDVRYETASAEHLPLPDASVDYVFTDPPFGSNIFYSDMNLFQEGWLGELTNHYAEAVVDRVDTGAGRTAESYERRLTGAFRECVRVLKPGGHISVVFGNSTGRMWALVQRAVAAAGLELEADLVTSLNKGQRSVKGLASGFEHVATIDLILTMRPGTTSPDALHVPSDHEIDSALETALALEGAGSPSHLYVMLVRHGIRRGWDLSSLDLRHVSARLAHQGVIVHPKTGRLIR
ncbi:MAG TPA: DNA methyltransferase [Acidimicrobiales bacterium]|nr:DNA methyltransferase [Acidimicrobiales bacterium]